MRIDLEDWFAENHYKYQQVGQLMHFPCKSCGGEFGRSGHLHQESSTIRCFQSACKWSNKWSYVARYITEHDSTADVKLPPRGQYIPPPVSKTEQQVKLPENFLPLIMGSGSIAKDARKYVESRGFDVEMLWEKYGVGYIKTNGKWFYNIVFPWKDENNVLRYYEGRDFSNFLFNNNRWQYPSLEEVGVGKSELLYNQDLILESGELWVTEGITDAITMSAIGLGGKSISIDQTWLLKSALASDIFIACDAGAWTDSLEIAKKLFGCGKNIWAVDLGEGFEDPNSLGKEKIESCERILISDPDVLNREFRTTKKVFDGRGIATYRGKNKSRKLW